MTRRRTPAAAGGGVIHVTNRTRLPAYAGG